ncbi:DUF2075 domain-containing protein [Ideonella livida]|uniref:DUF2075 domain-containing protein n=1 Tax=Ideonella livida TaxID=2707176 RepID=A0A7C9TNB1_9BURK|nr:DUF2075 domain-containing protein [Ideonella livida]NDY93904.1 DUF2075 domain-containing protein [Ideonella livida]
MPHHHYATPLLDFLHADPAAVLGTLVAKSAFDVAREQRDAWSAQIRCWQEVLRSLQDLLDPCAPHTTPGLLCFEFVLPRLGRRIDNVLIWGDRVWVLEFKVGATSGSAAALDQVWDYALDLKNFHAPSHDLPLVPVLVPTQATSHPWRWDWAPDQVARPLVVAPGDLATLLREALSRPQGPAVDAQAWLDGRYQPTPTIVEAARALYAGHSVHEISRSGAEGVNLSVTASALEHWIARAQAEHLKVLCLVTGVPGAGKTLVGLDIANRHREADSTLYSVFLSGNDPLVNILREALTRDQVARARERGAKQTKTHARQAVESFIQNVRHFRDDGLRSAEAPLEHVTVFDEAQRAWNQEQTRKFMTTKRAQASFDQSEPAFLLACMDRHADWAVVIGLVGGGQEINTGEAGIRAWIEALRDERPDWHLVMPAQLQAEEYGATDLVETMRHLPRVHWQEELHLRTSMRAFRANGVSEWVRQVLQAEVDAASALLSKVQPHFPIVLTRSLPRAKRWLRAQARGSERVGLVVSSQAQRLRPHAIDVRVRIDPVPWFLNDRDDVRSSDFLEDAATEFQVQGLELDWTAVVWDADFRRGPRGWEHWSFVSDRWQRIHHPDRQQYLKNAYRVLLTRARQGMVIVVPEGHAEDPTRQAAFYDPLFQYLAKLGLPVLSP